MIDFEKLDYILQYIKDNPEQHDQQHFGVKDSCGSTACFAGWTMLTYAPEKITYSPHSFLTGRPGVMISNTLDTIASEAAQVLGLAQGQGNALFYTAQSLAQVEACVKELHNNPESSFKDLIKAMAND